MVKSIWYSLRNILCYRKPRKRSRLELNLDIEDDITVLRRYLTMLYLDTVGLVLDGTTPPYTYLTRCQKTAIAKVGKFGYECGVVPGQEDQESIDICPEQTVLSFLRR